MARIVLQSKWAILSVSVNTKSGVFMKKVYALLFILSLIATYSVAKSNKKNKNITLVYYKLKIGDTLLTVAKRHHTTVSQILQVNKLDMHKKIKVGKVLKVPTNIYKIKQISGINRKKMNPNSKCIAHTVKKGDTILALARREQATVAQIERINRFSAKTKKLRLGETIFIPINTKKKQPPSRRVAKVQKKNNKVVQKKSLDKANKNFHVIKKGDTLYSLASQNNTTVAKIKEMNKISQSKRLKLGQKILLTENKEISTKSKRKNSLLVKKILEIDKKINEINNLRKIAFANDRTVRFSKRIEKSKVTDKEIYSLLSLGNSPVKLSIAKKHLGKRYVWGASGPKSFDCSGFTKYVCNQSGISIPRTSINQSKVGKRVGRGDLKAGDLIFFDTSRRHRGYVNHVGIYIGNNKFIHASSSKRRVVIASLNKPFYKSRFKWGSRIKS